MTTDRGYRFLAGVADVYFLSLSLGTVAALYTATNGRPLPLPLLVGFVFAIVASTLYHIVFAHRVGWLSPGEQMHGRRLREGTKHWTNPYGRNRWALFALNLMALVLLGNTWDSLDEGVVFRYPDVIGKLVFALAVATGLVSLGRGRFPGVFGPLLLYGGLAGAALQLAPQTAAPGFAQGTALVFLAVGILHLGVAYSYRRFAGSSQSPSSQDQAQIHS